MIKLLRIYSLIKTTLTLLIRILQSYCLGSQTHRTLSEEAHVSTAHFGRLQAKMFGKVRPVLQRLLRNVGYFFKINTYYEN